MTKTHIRLAIEALAIATGELREARTQDNIEDESLHMVIGLTDAVEAIASVLHHVERSHIRESLGAVQKS